MAGMPDEEYQALKARVAAKRAAKTGMSDEEYMALKQRVALKRKSREQEQVDETQDALRQMRAGRALAGSMTTLGETEGSPTYLSSRAAQNAQQNIQQADSPYDQPTVPVALTRTDLERAAMRTGGKIVPVGGTLQVQDDTGAAQSQLAQNANVTMKDWMDAPLGQKVSQVVTNAFDPASVAVGGAIYQAWTGKAAPAGYGMREGLMDVSEQVGRAAPRSMGAASYVAQLPAMAANAAGEKINRAQAASIRATPQAPGWLDRAVTAVADMADWAQNPLMPLPARPRGEALRAKAEANDAEAAQWRSDYEARKADAVKGVKLATSVTPDPEEGARLGRNVFATQAANIADVADPTNLLGLAMQGVSGGVRAAAANPEVRRAAGQAAMTMAQPFGDPTRRGLMSNVPAAVGAPEPVRGVLKGAESMAREYANVEAAQVLDALSDPRFTPEVRRVATDVWHDQGLRAAAAAKNPVVGELLDAAQREHFAQYLKWIRGRGLPAETEARLIREYNPLHLNYGQDFSEAATRMRDAAAAANPEVEARAADLMRKAGVKPGESQKMRDTPDPFLTPKTKAPGIRALYDDPATQEALQAKPDYSSWWKYTRRGEDDGNVLPMRGRNFAPGTRVRSSLEQTRADRAKFLAAEDVRAQQSMHPLSRYVNRVRGTMMDEADMLDDLERMGQQDVVSGLVESTRKVARKNPARIQRAMYKVLQDEDTLKIYRGVYGDDVGADAAQWVAQRTGGAEAEEFAKHIGGYGDTLVRRDNLRIPDAVAKELRERDLVIVRPRRAIDPNTNEVVEKLGYWADNAYNKVGHSVDIPGIAKPIIMPRRAALASLQIASGGIETTAKTAAEQLDRIFGNALANTAVTRANPGFQARNIQSEALRALIDDPRIFKVGVKESMDALANPATRRQAMELLGVGKDMGSRLDVFDAAPTASSLLPSGARRAATQAADIMARPGIAANNAFDDAVVRATFGKQQTGWGFTDLLRFHHWHRQVRAGVNPDVAALWTNQLFINYADKSAIESIGRSVFPFLRFYTGAAQGALGLALRHPERFRNLYGVANMVRAQDERDGTAVNAKARTAVDLFTGIPAVSDPGDDRRAMALRAETPLTESLAVYEALANQLGMSAPSDRRGGSLLGSGLTNMMKWSAPGWVERTTGYSPMNMPKDLRDAYSSAPGPMGTLPGMAYQAWQDSTMDPDIASAIGREPGAAMAWDTLRSAPFIGTALPPYLDPLARQYTGATGFSGRTPERSEEALQRLLRKSLTGFRGETFDVLGSAGRKRQPELKTGVDVRRKSAPWTGGGG